MATEAAKPIWRYRLALALMAIGFVLEVLKVWGR